MKVTKKQTQDYEKSLSLVIKEIEASRHKAITTVNKLLINLYGFIGKSIVDLQDKAKTMQPRGDTFDDLKE